MYPKLYIYSVQLKIGRYRHQHADNVLGQVIYNALIRRKICIPTNATPAKGPLPTPPTSVSCQKTKCSSICKKTSKALQEHETRIMMRRSNGDHYSLMASVLHNNQYGWGNR